MVRELQEANSIQPGADPNGGEHGTGSEGVSATDQRVQYYERLDVLAVARVDGLFDSVCG